MSELQLNDFICSIGPSDGIFDFESNTPLTPGGSSCYDQTNLAMEKQAVGSVSTGPPVDTSQTTASSARKRRRPALSCEQCRRRKIKCDRNYPCNHCIHSKTATCTYSPTFVLPKKGHVSNTVRSDQGVALRNRSQNIPLNTNESTGWGDNNNVATSDETCSASWGSPVGAVQSDETEIVNTDGLLDRMLRIEHMVENSGRLSKRDVKNLSSKTAPRELRGTVSKTRFFGQSHWMYSFGFYDKIPGIGFDPKINSFDFIADMITPDILELMGKCKSITRLAKSAPHTEWITNPNFREYMPPRHIADKLVKLYFRTAESRWRVLHVPSFQRDYDQYWEQPLAASPVLLIQILLVMSIGTCFYQEEEDEYYRVQAVKWIFAAQAWLSSPFEKGKLHISALQIYCLILIAREESSVAGDLVWISAGSLLRMAFQMGLHRDPKHLPRISIMQAEMRRRIWATILDINIQSALDSGMPNLISADDWDTEPPANIDDIDINESTNSLASKPASVFTQTSLQRMLLSSINPRLEVIRLANNFRDEPTYDEILQLDASLTKNLKENSHFIKQINTSFPNSPEVTQLQQNILDMSVRRFLLILHRPFSAKAFIDPRYYFSRKVCLDCAVTMLTYPSSSTPPTPARTPADENRTDDWTRLTIFSGGFFKGIIVHGAMIIFIELLALVPSSDSVFSTPSQPIEPLTQILRNLIDLSEKRIEFVENNIKGHLFLSVVLAQVEGLHRKEDTELYVLEAARNSLHTTYGLLQKRIRLPVQGMEGLPQVDGLSMETPAVGPFGTDFAMHDWTMEFESPDSWLLSGWDAN